MRRKVDRDRRVVVTGLGLISPLGTGVEKNWEALMAGRSGIVPITRFDTTDFPTKIAGEIPDFNPLDWIEKKDVRKMDLFIQYAMGAAEQAMKQSGLRSTEDNADNVGVLVGVGIGGLCTIEENHSTFLESRLKRITPFFIPKLISNLAPGQISIRYGARGANFWHDECVRLGQPCDRRGLSNDPGGLPRRGDHRRRRGGDYVARRGRLRRDARALDPQR